MNNELKICTKSRYKTEEEAHKTAKHIEDVDPNTKLRYYRCRICHHYHLTSSPK